MYLVEVKLMFNTLYNVKLMLLKTIKMQIL